jgi:hypothetical protein
MKKCVNIYVLIIFVFAIAGCTRNKIEFLPYDVKPKYVNTKISIFIYEAWNSFDVDEPMFLSVKNNSNEVVTFGYNYDSKIFYFDGDQWQEVTVSEQYWKEDVLLYPDQAHHFVILGQFPAIEGSIQVRVFIKGTMSESNRDVVSYIDLVLHR